MLTILITLCIVAGVAYTAKRVWPNHISKLEMVILIVVSILLTSAIYFAGAYSQTVDSEIWNGVVTNKHAAKTSCSHSYQCHCRVVTRAPTCTKGGCSGGGSRTECDTCYEHLYDINWVVASDIGSWNIDRIDRQGLQEPPRFTIVKQGDPVSATHTYTNYIKGAPDSLFHAYAGLMQQYQQLIPTYPLNVYDVYKIDRAIVIGKVQVPQLDKWNYELSVLNGKLGPQKQVNVAIVFVDIADQKFQYALESAWLGGKKNDVIIVFGTTKYPSIDWVGVISWTDKQLFKVQLRDELFAQKQIDMEKTLSIIQQNVSRNYERKHMADFEYLKYEIEPPLWVLILSVVLGSACAVGLAFVFRDVTL